MTVKTIDDPRWQRIVARDKTADGEFWYSVRTTGIYCRPSCPSRAANPENVALHDSLEEARASGCRPCKRCKPDGSSSDAENAALVEQACRLIESADGPPSLAALAEATQLESWLFPPSVQDADRAHAARLCRRASCEARARGAE